MVIVSFQTTFSVSSNLYNGCPFAPLVCSPNTSWWTEIFSDKLNFSNSVKAETDILDQSALSVFFFVLMSTFASQGDWRALRTQLTSDELVSCYEDKSAQNTIWRQVGSLSNIACCKPPYHCPARQHVGGVVYSLCACLAPSMSTCVNIHWAVYD